MSRVLNLGGIGSRGNLLSAALLALASAVTITSPQDGTALKIKPPRSERPKLSGKLPHQGSREMQRRRRRGW